MSTREADDPEIQRKKELLRQQLSTRYSTARQEFVRLERIRKELEKLEGHLTTDVNVLRDRIDEADRSVSYAQRERDRCKAAFEAAEAAFQKRVLEKSRLTEHLGLIIAENERRKKERLEELMKELGLQEDHFEGFAAAEDADAGAGADAKLQTSTLDAGTKPSTDPANADAAEPAK